MPIIQGSNQPIIVTFDNDITDIKDLHVALFSNHEPLKEWYMDDIIIEGNTATCPLKQAETLSFKRGACTIEIKWMDEEGDVYLSEIVRSQIIRRDDIHVIGGESNG